MSEEVTVDVSDHVATVEFHRPPANYFDADLITALADAYERLDADPDTRAIVLCSEGRHFCAGAMLAARDRAEGPRETKRLYANAVRMFAARTPVVAAVQGVAIGGGLGVALSADFRVASPESRFAANFAKLGFHQGFGISVTLPAVVGQQAALDMLYTGRRVPGEEAHALRLADRLATAETLRDEARTLARELAESAPLAVASIRQTMRGHLAEQVRDVLERERAEQQRLTGTEDFQEGVRAVAERRAPTFKGV
jgi:2-(1,2-epoxy-1,2-dihydrophenyl)acetyl-CoA isomerase